MADPNPSAKMERKTQRRPAEIKPRIIERRGKKGSAQRRGRHPEAPGRFRPRRPPLAVRSGP